MGPEPSQFEISRDELELAPTIDIAAIHVNHAVAVEEESAVVNRQPKI